MHNECILSPHKMVTKSKVIIFISHGTGIIAVSSVSQVCLLGILFFILDTR